MSHATEPRSPAAVRREIELLRTEVAASARELRRRVRGLGDWRSWVGRSPVGFLAGALALGFWLGNRRSASR